jgi:RND family efflux transporter MFP subunit
MSDPGEHLSLAALKIDRSAPLRQPRRRPLRLAAVVGVVAVLALVGWRWQATPTVTTTTVVMSAPSRAFVELTASGHVVAQRRAAVASKATGRLVDLRVSEGSKVVRGELIARLDDSDVEAALQGSRAALHQAKANLQQAQVEQVNAQRDLQRSRSLQAQGFISDQALDTGRGRVDASAAAVLSAQAAVERARAQLGGEKVNRSYTEIRAPFDGVVLVKSANLGDIITPLSSAAGAQGAVVTMADLSSLEVEADVSETNLAKVAVNQSVEITLDALPGTLLRGTVAAIVPTVDPAKATIKTKIRFEKLDPRVLPEMSAKVAFLSRPVSASAQRPVLAVAPASISRRGGMAQVWRVATDGAQQRLEAVPVQTGRAFGDLVEILAGSRLKSGDTVVLDPSAALSDGALVRAAGG